MRGPMNVKPTLKVSKNL